jgi:hypothetical protein
LTDTLNFRTVVCRLFFDKSNKRSIKLETTVTWSKSNLNMMNIYEERTINFWICLTNDHIIFNVGTPSLEARNIRLDNIITYIIKESKLISENMSPNVIYC